MNDKIAFVGGGNMASALVGGLIANGCAASSLSAVDIAAEQLAERRLHVPDLARIEQHRRPAFRARSPEFPNL